MYKPISQLWEELKIAGDNLVNAIEPKNTGDLPAPTTTGSFGHGKALLAEQNLIKRKMWNNQGEEIDMDDDSADTLATNNEENE